MDWNAKLFAQLTLLELYEILQLRNEVFIVEQNCPYQDLDDKDKVATHLWTTDQAGKIVAYCRLLPVDVSYKEPSIGRVATHKDARKSGLGRALMVEAIRHITEEWHEGSIRISAQSYLKVFYESLGFVPVGEEYLEDNIPHIEMLRGVNT